LPNIEELNIVVDLEFDVIERKDFMNIDVSIISGIDERYSDKESEEDNAVFIGDGEFDSQREYFKNFVIVIFPNVELWQGAKYKCYSFNRLRVFGPKVCLINGSLD
jgi:hypothetical protein